MYIENVLLNLQNYFSLPASKNYLFSCTSLIECELVMNVLNEIVDTALYFRK